MFRPISGSLRTRVAQTILFVASITFCLQAASVRADERLHERLDRLIEADQISSAAPIAGDAEFLRRVYLDLVGTIPTSAEARAFLDDANPQKREQVIDRLLKDRRHVRHMANVFDVMLMERRGDKHVKSPEWTKYLEDSFAVNKPWNQLAREILAADGVDPKLRPAAKFYLDRDAEINKLTRDVSRMFFGKDLECAQCHDHPLIDNYAQADYYGVYAFLNRSYLFTDKAKKKTFLAEKAVGDVNFKSVFTGDADKTRPRLPGDFELAEPRFPAGEQFQVKPAAAIQPIPKYSRRARLAELATNGSNRAFNRNIVNRLWAHMMGRGLVHPVDLHHPDNPPSHPEALDLLAGTFVEMKFDIRALLRELALTRTYQRSFESPGHSAEQIAAAAAKLPAMEAEKIRLASLVEQAEQAVEKAVATVAELKKKVEPVDAELAKADTAAAAALKPYDEAAKKLSGSQNQLATKQELAKLLSESAAKGAEAAKQLSADKELATAVGKLDARAKKLTAEATALTKTVAQQSTAAKTAGEKLAAANKTATAVFTKMELAHKPYDAAKHEFLSRTSKTKAAYQAVNAIDRQIESVQAIVEYGNVLAAVEQARDAQTKAKTELAAARETAAKIEKEMQQRKQVMGTAQTAHAQTAAVFKTAQEQAARQDALVKIVASAAASTQAALKQLADDPELTAALEKLNARKQSLTADLDQLRKVAAEKDAAAKETAKVVAEAQKTVDASAAQLAAMQTKTGLIDSNLQQAVAEEQKQLAAVEDSDKELTENSTHDFSVASIEPLTPEQLAWSVLQASGMVEKQRAASTAEFNKKNPPKENEKNDPAKQAERLALIEQQSYDKLKGNVATFVKLFGGAAGQVQTDFFATVDQALFFSNAGQTRSWFAVGGGNLTDRLNKTEDPKAFAEELYLSMLTRRPSEAEVADITQYFAGRPKDRPAAVQEIVWALLTSTEFRFNH